jgi:hypothetical protein
VAILKSIVARTASAPAARALEVVLYAASAAWLGAAFLIAAAIPAATPLSNLLVALTLLSLLVAAAVGVTFLARWAELYGQRARDLHAQAVFTALQAGQTAPAYCLYLRPFASTGAFSETGGAMITGLGFGGLAGEEVELEAQMERAVRPLGPLIALGQPLEHVGAGRILVGEDEWRAAIKDLMAQARLIVMLPSSREGTRAEIEMILDSNLIERTVFIDPPNIARSRTYDHSAEWKHVREAFASRGFDMPRDSRVGALMFFGGERVPRFRERLDIDAEDRIERLFRRVIKAQPRVVAAASA